MSSAAYTPVYVTYAAVARTAQCPSVERLQSAGEIRQRTDRLHTFSSLDEVEETLTWFIEYPHGPLVRLIPVGEGRRVESFAHLLSPAAVDSFSATGAPPATSDTPAENDWRAAIEARLTSLESEIALLKAGRRDS